jgi:chitinase
MQSKDKKVIVSLGGQSFRADWASFDISQIKKIIDDYGFDGLDLDLESISIPSGDYISIISQEIVSLVTEYRNTKYFMLTCAPEWPYIVPYTYGSGQWASYAFANENYYNFIREVGI